MKKLSITIVHSPLQDLHFDGHLPSKEEFNQHVLFIALDAISKQEHPCVGCAASYLGDLVDELPDELDDSDEDLRQHLMYIAMAACGLWVMVHGRTLDIDQPIALSLDDIEHRFGEILHDSKEQNNHSAQEHLH